MIAFLLGLALFAQAAAPPPQQDKPPLKDDSPVTRELSPAHSFFYEREGGSSPEARAAMHDFGACVASHSSALAAATLSQDFKSRSYRLALQRLVNNNSGCFHLRGRMRSGGLFLAGAMAEKLLAGDAQPLNVRLARAALHPAPRAFSPSDQMAICVVRSVPDETGKLFATKVASPEEKAAVEALAPAVAACSGSTGRVESSAGGLRAILATAAFRSVSPETGNSHAKRD